MKRAIWIAALLTGLLAVSQPAWSQPVTPAPSASPTADALDMSFTGAQVAVLLKAMSEVDTSPKILVDMLQKPAAKMPAYDPVAHYAGVNPKNGVAVIWISSNATVESAKLPVTGATVLACMDTGFAGVQWKAVYDRLAAADAALPAADSNRYRNRLRFTAWFQNVASSHAR